MKVLAQNRKAFHEYEVLDKFEAGISLLGHEVKAIREGRVDFEGSFVKFVGETPKIVNLHIGRFSKQGDAGEADTRRERDLLLNRFEIDRISGKASQKGYTLAPLKLVDNHGLIKLEFALVRGKKKYGKKEVEKIKQQEMDAKREAKESFK